MRRAIAPLILLPEIHRLAEPHLVRELCLDISQRLRAAGWSVNIAFEIDDEGDRFTLSGARAP